MVIGPVISCDDCINRCDISLVGGVEAVLLVPGVLINNACSWL